MSVVVAHFVAQARKRHLRGLVRSLKKRNPSPVPLKITREALVDPIASRLSQLLRFEGCKESLQSEFLCPSKPPLSASERRTFPSLGLVRSLESYAGRPVLLGE